MAGFWFSDYVTAANSPGWLRKVSVEIQAACRDAGTQWMVIICLLSYLIVFIVLEAKSNAQSLKSKGNEILTSPWSAPLPAGAERENFFARVVPFCGKSLDAWLCAFLVLVLLRYAFDYANATRSLQVVVLLTGIVIGKGIALWVSWGNRRTLNVEPRTLNVNPHGEHPTSNIERPTSNKTEAQTSTVAKREAERSTFNFQPSTFNKAQAVLGILIFLLALSALWHPERGMEFFYRGQQRWTGPWDNPNLFGLLMGVGVVLAVGLLGASYRLRVAGLDAPRSRGWRISRLEILFPILLFASAALCGYGLIRSYSRGAWLGTAVGLGILIWNWAQRERIEPAAAESGASNWSREKIAPRQGMYWPWIILLLSLLVVSFWQFRHTEAPLARRVFSVGNLNDFSWRNRVAAWDGARRMMADRPMVGFGWGAAEKVYAEKYRAARLEESAAIQMNDYLMLGISAGTPALFGLVAYVLMIFRGVGIVRPEASEPLPSNSWLAYTCGAGALLLLIGFWFDGGLFKLPTAVVFWLLLELTRAGGRRTLPGEQTMLRPPVAATRPSAGEPSCLDRPRSRWLLRWLAGISAAAAVTMTTLHLGVPQLKTSDRTLWLARKWLVPAQEKSDFDFLAAQSLWTNQKLKVLLQHVHLANYNRSLVRWNVSDDLYRDFVLSPELHELTTSHPPLATDRNWRRPLWEFFYPRIRKETTVEGAAAIVLRQLRERIKIEAGDKPRRSVRCVWQGGVGTEFEFQRVAVATLRSVGIPARLAGADRVEFWDGNDWREAPPD